MMIKKNVKTNWKYIELEIFFFGQKTDFSTGGFLIGGLLILGDRLFLNYQKKIGQRGLINTVGIINPNLTLDEKAHTQINKKKTLQKQ